MQRRDFLAGGLAAFGASLVGGAAMSQALPPRLQPALVTLRHPLPVGEVHVFPDHFQLFWTLPNQQAWRYGIRVGREGLYEPGRYYVGAKKEWPSWKPTPGMVEREPEKYAQYEEEGMEGGPNNPLGARALYLYQGNRDTMYRIHGTPQPWTMGRSFSSGCIRMINEHMIDLYDRVPMGTTVIVGADYG